jgi:hypothetical protein
MSFYLNDLDKQFVPSPRLLLDFCAVRSSAAANRWILVAKHDIQLIQGERVCVRCWRMMKEIEEALEAREKSLYRE